MKCNVYKKCGSCHYINIDYSKQLKEKHQYYVDLYKEFKAMFDEYANFQRVSYELMYKFGWYQLEKATKTKVSNLTNALETDINNLN